ncbi:Hypothetical predicted protein [Scomber scombrus]|uniref:Uncharacterized protein n=1 Tax=Scomber scombrus TaxID=13677 RepID=A0AAV1N0Y1_SCOSC
MDELAILLKVFCNKFEAVLIKSLVKQKVALYKSTDIFTLIGRCMDFFTTTATHTVISVSDRCDPPPPHSHTVFIRSSIHRSFHLSVLLYLSSIQIFNLCSHTFTTIGEYAFTSHGMMSQ